VLAEIAEALFGQLKAPPRRLGSPRIPVPYSKPLEDLCRVGPHRIAAAAAALCRGGAAPGMPELAPG
jgi:pyruvate dehydrogenase E1 component beta subunit